MNVKNTLGNIWEKMTSLPVLLLCLFIVSILIGVAYYVYYNYVKTNTDYVENREIISDSDNNFATLYLIYADWCPHSKKIRAIDNDDPKSGGWKKLTNKWNSENSDLRLINNYSITLVEINQSDEKELNSFEKTFNKEITGFPSIYLVKDEQVIEFNANPTEENLIKFLNDVV